MWIYGFPSVTIRMPLPPVPPRVNLTAVWTGASCLWAVVKLVIDPRQIFHNALQLYLGTVHQGAAVGAVPFKAIGHSGRPHPLDYQAQAARFGPLRRVAQVGRQQKDVPFV